MNLRALFQKIPAWLWILASVVVITSCICTVAIATPFVVTAIKTAAAWKPAQALLTEYMQEMDAKDAKSAQALFSPHMQAQTPDLYLQTLLDEPSYAMFNHFQSLAIDMLVLRYEPDTDPTQPQGTTAHVNGMVKYSDGYTGTYVAIIEKVDQKWMIYSMTVTVPQDKR